jgi:4-amino-4-deoxy-L-arabinose transferase-like glycosyltransferase
VARGRRAALARLSPRTHPDLFIVAGIFAAAMLARAWGVQWSLPYVGHVDEPKIVDSGVQIVKTGDLNPHLFIWPSLVIYIQALIYKLNLLWGTWRGYYVGPQSLPDQNHIFALAPGLYLWGRTFSALVGAAAVAGCFALGRAMFGRAAGILAAFLLLTSPLHVEYSHYLVTDVTVGACGLLALALAWRLATHPGRRVALLAGAAVGLCPAAKYNGLYIALPVGIAWLLAWRRLHRGDPRPATSGRWLLVALGMVVAAAAVFLITNPYVILDWTHWSRGFVFQVNAYLPANTVGQIATAFGKQVDALWTTDTALLAAGLAGSLVLLVEAIRQRRSNANLVRAAWLLLPFPLAYTLAMSRFTEIFERNLIITLPFVCLAFGYGAARVAEVVAPRLPSRARVAWAVPAVAAILGLLVVAEPARRVFNFDEYMGKTESRNAAWAWLQGELRAGHRAAVELHTLQTCAPPPWKCPAPDVLAPNTPLTEHPPIWYANHGYDYVLLVGQEIAYVGNPDKEGRRPPAQLAPYLALPEVRRFAGDAENGKGPTVRVLRVLDSLQTILGVTPSGAHFGPVAELWGYNLAPLPTAGVAYDPSAAPPPAKAYRPGAAAGVTLYWRALPGAATTPGNWTVALHLNDRTGKTVAQVDVQPISSGHIRPVSDWYANEFLVGAYNIPLPPTLAPGAYNLTLALYNAPTGPGLPVEQTGQAPAPVLDLGTIQVTP